MAYYDALVTKWATLSSTTTAAKLKEINSATVNSTTPVPMIVPTYTIYNSIAGSEFAALTAANQQLIRDILNMGTVDASPGTSVRTRVVATFPSSTVTFSNLSAIAKNYDTPPLPWWEVNGYSSPIDGPDLAAAGGLN